MAQYLVEPRPDNPQEAFIDWVGVRADYRSKGIGRRVVEEILDDLRTKGFKRVIISSYKLSTGFWEKMGFHVTRSGTELDRMERELAPKL